MAESERKVRTRSRAPKRNAMLRPEVQEELRSRIQTRQITNRLADHVAGKVDMSPTQVQAALGLLRKTLPDLSAVDSTVDAKVSTKFERKVYATEKTAVSVPGPQASDADETDQPN